MKHLDDSPEQQASVPCVCYAAKSTEDRHGSIPTQLDDCRGLAAHEGWSVVDEFSDEGFSAYKGNRGPGLARAKEAAVANAPCVLVVQDLDRLARGAGDAPGAADHLGELFFALRRQGVTLWSVRTGEVDSLRAVLEGERSHSESERKSGAVRAGLKRRAERGKPVGAVPIGYRVEHVLLDGEPVTRRVIDEEGATLYERIVSAAEHGMTPGAITRMLNAEGHRTRRGNPFQARLVRAILRNDDYLGGTGYPALITRERWDAIQERLGRMDPAAVAARKGGRPASEDYILSGVAFCGACGERMYARQSGPNSRWYRCKHAMEGACEAKGVRADVAEANVLMHLETVVGEQLRAWLAERAAEHENHRAGLVAAAERERGALRALEKTLQRAEGQHRRLLVGGDEALADAALRTVAGLQADVDAARRAVGDAEARAAEFDAAPDQQAAIEHLTHLAALIGGRLKEAKDGAAINAVLREALEGLWLTVEDGTLHVEMRARAGRWLGRTADARDLSGPSEWLARLDKTERQTFV